MISLTVKQNNQQTEQVSSALIDTLYNLAYENEYTEPKISSGAADIVGSINAPAAYEDAVIYLRAKFPNLNITVTDNNYYVRFKDPAIEAIIAAQFGSDGKITVSQAAAVTALPNNMFANNTDIEDFSDFARVLPNCRTIGERCFQNSSIKYFDFSNIATGSFYESFKNSQLEGDLSMPLLTGTLDRAFINTKISSISNLGSITKITGNSNYGASSFRDCTNLTSIVFPPTIVSVEQGAFEGCTNINSIKGEENIVTCQFRIYSINLTNDVINLAKCESIWGSCFGTRYKEDGKRGAFGQIYIPKIKQTSSNGYSDNFVYGDGLFRAMVSCKLAYLRDIETLHPGDFSFTNINALIINNATPPNINNKDDKSDTDTTISRNSWKKLFDGFTGVVYVPDTALTDYQNDAKWSTFSLTMRGISELSRVATEEDWIEAGRPANTLIEAYM